MAELPSFNFPCPVVFPSWHSEITHLSKLATRPSSFEPLLRLQLLDFSISFQFSLSQISASVALNLPSVTLKRRYVLGKVCEGPINGFEDEPSQGTRSSEYRRFKGSFLFDLTLIFETVPAAANEDFSRGFCLSEELLSRIKMSVPKKARSSSDEIELIFLAGSLIGGDPDQQFAMCCECLQMCFNVEVN
ncbi:hypothetical protein C1H46_005585 [Malus baccata]|uniref:Uncharacterized protein n=1 Tax=Malus baccata TaxID=106549 RepID=A0A540NCP2_MALBA|nr:hypothetical protein C1H46_005585 [Malus baccata]